MQQRTLLQQWSGKNAAYGLAFMGKISLCYWLCNLPWLLHKWEALHGYGRQVRDNFHFFCNMRLHEIPSFFILKFRPHAKENTLSTCILYILTGVREGHSKNPFHDIWGFERAPVLWMYIIKELSIKLQDYNKSGVVHQKGFGCSFLNSCTPACYLLILM